MKRIFTLITILCALGAGAQGVKPLPSLHTEGRWLVDKHGNQVVLHGVMDTPSNYFNGGRWEGSKALGWWDHYNDTGVTNCLAYFEKLFKGMEKAKCDVFRLHMDPAWTNDPADGYVYAETDGFWGACTKATGGRLVEGKDPGWRNHQQIPIQTPYYTQFAQWIEDDSKIHSCNIETAYHGYEILEGMCLSALKNVRIDLPVTDLSYEPVFDQMRRLLPECGSRKMYIYDGKTPRKERD